MARQTRSKADTAPVLASTSRAAGSSTDGVPAAPGSDNNNDVAGAISSLTPAELAALVERPVGVALGVLERLVKAGGTVWTLGQQAGEHGESEADADLLWAKRAVGEVLSPSQGQADTLFLALPPLSTTPAAQLAPLQQANLVRLALVLPQLARAATSQMFTPDVLDLIWEIREFAWRAVFSLLGLAAVAVEGSEGDAGRVGRVLASGRREKELRDGVLRKRVDIMLRFCSFAYVALLSAPRPDAHVDRLAEVFLPSFMGSPDQVALPGRERGAIFRSTREKEAVLQIWADEVDKRQAEIRSLTLEELQQTVGGADALEQLLAFLVTEVRLPFLDNKKALSFKAGDFLDSQAPGERMTETFEDFPPFQQPAADSRDESDDQIQIDASLGLLESQEPQEIVAARQPAPSTKGKGKAGSKGKGRAVDPPAADEGEAFDQPHAFGSAPESSGAQADFDPTFGGDSQEFGASASGAAAEEEEEEGPTFIDSQESLMSSLGAGVEWSNYRQLDGGIDDYVRNLAGDDQDLYSQDEPQPQDAYVAAEPPAPDESSNVADADAHPPAHLQSAKPLGLSIRPKGKKRARASSTASAVEAGSDRSSVVVADSYAESSQARSQASDVTTDVGLAGPSQKRRFEEPLPPRKRKPTPGRGNSLVGNKGYLYFQGRNENGRKSWTPEEDECLLQGLAKFEKQKLIWSKIMKEHGPDGTVDQILADRNSVSLKDRARNLKVIMAREGKAVPTTLGLVMAPKRYRDLPPDPAAHGAGEYPQAGPSHTEASVEDDDEGGGGQNGQDEGHGHELLVDPALLG